VQLPAAPRTLAGDDQGKLPHGPSPRCAQS
jgi:hypothetical protein